MKSTNKNSLLVNILKLYNDNHITSLILEFFIVYIILKISENTIICQNKFYNKIYITLIITTLVYLYIMHMSYTNNNIDFLKKLGKKLGWHSILIDTIYYILVGQLINKFMTIKQPKHIITFINYLLKISLIHLLMVYLIH